MPTKSKKDREYMEILDQPGEILKKPMGRPVDFWKVISQLLKDSDQRKKSKIGALNHRIPLTLYKVYAQSSLIIILAVWLVIMIDKQIFN